MKNNPQQQESWKNKTVFTFYTGVSGQEIVLESKLLEKIDQGEDVDELLIHVKMPSKDTKEFRKAISTERQRVLDEVRELVEGMRRPGACDESTCFCNNDIEEDCEIVKYNQALNDLLSALKEMEGEK